MDQNPYKSPESGVRQTDRSQFYKKLLGPPILFGFVCGLIFSMNNGATHGALLGGFVFVVFAAAKLIEHAIAIRRSRRK